MYLVVQVYLKEIFQTITTRGNDMETQVKKKQRKTTSGLVMGHEQQRKSSIEIGLI
jgi:hypothetical protein